MKKLLLLSAVAFGLPFAAFAATYNYVNTAGSLQSVQANNADQALALAANIAPHSGVALDTGTVIFAAPLSVSVGNATYEYVNTSGNLQAEQAPNAAMALAGAVNIAPNSGVMLVGP